MRLRNSRQGIEAGKQHANKLQARSSAGERYLDMVEVGGSKPPVPTNSEKG